MPDYSVGPQHIRSAVTLRSGRSQRNRSGADPNGQTAGFMAKIHFCPEDLTPEQGCLAFIAGSHRYPTGTPRPQIDYRRDSALVKKIVPKAGDAVLFSPDIFNMCLDNSSQDLRKVTFDGDLPERRSSRLGSDGDDAPEEATLWFRFACPRRLL